MGLSSGAISHNYIISFIIYSAGQSFIAYDSLVHQNGPCSQTLHHTDILN